MDNQQATSQFNMGWLVGFIEGEGCFELRKQVYRNQKPTLRPKVSAVSTDFQLIERAIEIIHELGVGVYLYKRKSVKGYKEKLEFTVGGILRCNVLLSKIIPYMTDSRRRNAAQTLLEFCSYRLSLPKRTPYGIKEFKLGKQLRNLNGYKLRNSFRDSTRDVFNYNTKVESTV